MRKIVCKECNQEIDITSKKCPNCDNIMVLKKKKAVCLNCNYEEEI